MKAKPSTNKPIEVNHLILSSLMAIRDRIPFDIHQLCLVSVLMFYLCWWVYRLYSRPINGTASLQGIIALVGFVFLLTPTLYLIFEGDTITINRQVISLGFLHILSIISLFWASEPNSGLQQLKFFVIMWVSLIVLINFYYKGESIEIIVDFLALILLVSFIITIGLLFYITTGGIIGGLRTAGFDTQLNFYVVSAVIMLPLLCHRFYHPQRERKLQSIILFISAVTILLASASRLPIVVLFIWLVGLIVFDHSEYAGWKYSQRTAISMIIISSTIAVATIAIEPDLLGRLINQTLQEMTYILESQLSSDGPLRAQIYLVTLHLLTHPEVILYGVGFGNFGVVFADLTGSSIRPHPHNVFLKYLVETGIIGLLISVVSLGYPLQYAYRAIQAVDKQPQLSLYIAITWSYVFILIISLFQPLMARHQFYILSASLFCIYCIEVDDDPKDV